MRVQAPKISTKVDGQLQQKVPDEHRSAGVCTVTNVVSWVHGVCQLVFYVDVIAGPMMARIRAKTAKYGAIDMNRI